MEEATFRFGCSATWLDEALAFANSELHLRLQNPQQREIQLVPMPVPVPGCRVDWCQQCRSSRADSTVPTRSSSCRSCQGVVEPCVDHIWSRIAIASHFAEMNRNSSLRQFSPRAELLLERSPVGDHPALSILQGPGGYR